LRDRSAVTTEGMACGFLLTVRPRLPSRMTAVGIVLVATLSLQPDVARAVIGIPAQRNEFRINTASRGGRYPYWWSGRTISVQPDGSRINLRIDTGGADRRGEGLYLQRTNADGTSGGDEALIDGRDPE